MKKYEAHPAAELFPMMDGKAFDEFVEDIRANGLIDPIKLNDGKIIDGRNRQSACIVAGVEPRYETVNPKDVVHYIISTNIHRRHLTTAQRAAIAAELANMEMTDTLKKGDKSPAGSNDPAGKVSNQQAAIMMGVSSASVKRAKKTMKENPSEHEAVKRGEKVTKPKAKHKKAEKQKKIHWSAILLEYGLYSPTNNASKSKARDEVMDVDPTLELGRGGIDPSLEARLRVACEEVRRRRDPAGDKDEAQDEAQSLDGDLSLTAKDRLGGAIRAHKRVLEAEYEMRIQDRVNEELQAALDNYNAVAEKQKRVVKAYKGPLTKTEYKMLLGVLHADKYPGIDDVQRARIDKVFSLISDKKLELCGDEGNGNGGSTLPKTVSDLMQMKATKRGA